jgi:hypothetical protein
MEAQVAEQNANEGLDPNAAAAAGAAAQDAGAGDGGEGDDADESVTLTKAEWNKFQAQQRKLAKQVRDLAKAATPAPQQGGDEDEGDEGEAAPAPKKKAAKGDATARAELRAEREALRAERLDTAVTAELVKRGYSERQAEVLLRSVDRDAITFNGTKVDRASVTDAVDTLVDEYGDEFRPAARKAGEKQPRRGAPATPPQQKNLPPGFLSPEEYAQTPVAARMSPEFMQRVEQSRPYWEPFRVERA